jgi:hypothetical protein
VSPTARTLAALRKAGWIACVVERWLPKVELRRDAFGFGDILACRPLDRQVLLVQATSLANVGARVAKIKSKPEAAAWIRSGGAIECWGWAKRGDRWRAKIVEVKGEALEPVIVTKPGRRQRAMALGDLFAGVT